MPKVGTKGPPLYSSYSPCAHSARRRQTLTKSEEKNKFLFTSPSPPKYLFCCKIKGTFSLIYLPQLFSSFFFAFLYVLNTERWIAGGLVPLDTITYIPLPPSPLLFPEGGPVPKVFNIGVQGR